MTAYRSGHSRSDYIGPVFGKLGYHECVRERAYSEARYHRNMDRIGLPSSLRNQPCADEYQRREMHDI